MSVFFAIALANFGLTFGTPFGDLEPLAFERLPVGSIRPTGWLQRQLEIAADGYTGHLCDFYNLCYNSTWMGGDQEAPNPEVLAYWLNGAAPLAFQIDNEHLREVVGRVVDYILEHPQKDGLLGAPLIELPDHGQPPRFGNGTLYWSKSVLVYALQQYAEGNTSDTRTIPALKRHFEAIGHHLMKTTPPAMWGASRWVESAIGIQWMLDRGFGGAKLFEVLHSFHDQSTAIYDWQTRFLDDGPIWDWKYNNSDLLEKELHHGVNLAQAIKLGAVWSRVSKKKSDLDNTAIALDRLERLAGSPSGTFMSDELLTMPNTPYRGTETCNVVETMWSMENAFAISGNISYADRLERLAYNALPAALWPDITANVYLQQTNEIMAKDNGPDYAWQHDGPHSTVYGLFRCCTSNFNQGWPKFAQSVVHLTGDGGLAVVVYAPATASTPKVGGGATVAITTDYPFSDTVELTVTSKSAFPLHLRIPSWVEGATVSIDGQTQTAAPGTMPKFTVGPRSKVLLTMRNGIRVIPGYNDSSVSIHRGPLLFAMDIGNKVKQIGTTAPGFNQYQVEATKPWNMALDISEGALKYVGAKGSLPHQPFSPEDAPVHITARGRQLPHWNMLNNSASPPPMSPVHSAEPWQDLVFVPYGSTNIRMAQLPSLATGSFESLTV